MYPHDDTWSHPQQDLRPIALTNNTESWSAMRSWFSNISTTANRAIETVYRWFGSLMLVGETGHNKYAAEIYAKHNFIMNSNRQSKDTHRKSGKQWLVYHLLCTVQYSTYRYIHTYRYMQYTTGKNVVTYLPRYTRWYVFHNNTIVRVQRWCDPKERKKYLKKNK